MSIITSNSMTNNHASGVLSQLTGTLHVWHERYRARKALSEWTTRDLQDVGLTWSDVASEAEKPFWRA